MNYLIKIFGGNLLKLWAIATVVFVVAEMSVSGTSLFYFFGIIGFFVPIGVWTAAANPLVAIITIFMVYLAEGFAKSKNIGGVKKVLYNIIVLFILSYAVDTLVWDDAGWQYLDFYLNKGELITGWMM